MITIIIGGAYLMISFFWRERVSHLIGWEVPGDIWGMVRQAQYVESGAVAYVYDVPGQFALPLFPILLAPVVTIGDHFHLVIGYPAPLFWPSMWPLIAGFCVPLGVFPLMSARTLVGPGPEIRQLCGQAVIGGVVLAPMYRFGHYEDMLALACVFVAVRLIEEEPRGWMGPLMFGVAIAFKQWALLGLPVLILAVPAARRARALTTAAVLPALLALPLLVFDFHAAAAALFGSPSFAGSYLGHVIPLMSGKPHVVVTAPFRVATFVLAAFLAVVTWRRRVPSVAAMALVFLGRALLEPVMYAYYLSPGLALAVIHAWRTRHGQLVVSAAACFAIWWCFVRTVPRSVWSLVAVVAAGVAASPAAREIWSQPEGHSDALRMEPRSTQTS